MTRSEWLEWRRQGIGGSDIGAILGVSKFRTRFDIWVDKVHGRAEFSTTDTRRGNHLEAGIASWWAEESGRAAQKAESIEHPREPWARCTPDYYATTPTGEPLILSIKAPRRSDGWGEPGSESVPLEYYLQVQWELLVTSGALRGASAEIVALLHGELARYPIAPNADVQQNIFARAREFWEGHVVPKVPPPLDSGEAVGPWLSRRYSAKPTKEFIASTPEIDLLALEWRTLEAEGALLEKRIDELKNRIRDAIGTADAAGVDGPFGRISWRADKNGKRSLKPRWTK